MNKRATAVGIVLSFVLGGALIWGLHALQGSETDNAIAARTNTDLRIPVGTDDPTWGAPTAPVTIVVFSDYQCPFCNRLENTLHQVKSNYGPAKVRIVWKQFPLQFHEHARPAALASATVYGLGGNQAFWPFHDKLFSHQRGLNRANFVEWATQVGLNEAKFKAALDSNRFSAKLERDISLGRTLGVHGTPHTFVNGISLDGMQPLRRFQTLIDEQLAAADELMKQGIKPDQVYARLLKKNWAQRAERKRREKEARKNKPAADTTVWQVPVGTSPVRGAKDALVTIVLFSDFQCPFCKRVGPAIERIMKQYDGKVRLVWKDRPLSFHPRAEPCAEFARAVRAVKGDEGFWEAHRLLFESNPKLDNDDLKRIAGKLGVPWAPIEKAMENARYADDIDADTDLAQRLRANGTPHMFINGRRLVGALPYDTIKKVVDEQLKKARNLVAGGTPASAVYDRLMSKAKEPPPSPKAPRKHLQISKTRGPSKGAANGAVVLQLISDFQCPFCRQVEPTVTRLLAKHPKLVKVVWVNNPLNFHKNAMLAAEAAAEVFAQKGNKGFWKYHDVLFENQRSPHGLEREALEKYAAQLGCNMKRFRAALDNHTHRKAIEQERESVAQAGIKGTPGILINGYYINGARPMAVFERAIKRARRDLRK